ncbi:MAG: TIGR03960 family B12-binding radical SAM protein [Desulfovibrionaceae bacterium]|nr:TIGR03960 family B12-binding radical SAM protein [Desulfovibrionaceae bacterium]
MREILGSILRPAHYAGIEDGSIIKDKDAVRLHIALAFPDRYEVGMSYLGQKILYAIVNNTPGWYAERVMAPERAVGTLLRAKQLPLTTLETDTPLADLDLIGFSITHELCYTNVLYMLDCAGIALWQKERTALTPLIIAGGGALLGAEPLAPFMDLMVLGDGEEAFPRLLHKLEEAKAQGCTKEDFLAQAADLPGIYVPSFFTDDTLTSLRPSHQPKRTIVADLNTCAYPERQVVPIDAVHNRLSVEIARGCTRGCRFCQAGMVYRPARERSVAKVRDIVQRALDATGFEELSFLALSSGDYSALKELTHATIDQCKKAQIAFSLPSQRVGSIDDTILARMADLRRTGMTLAPEAGSQRLRDVINKGITEEDLILHAQKLLEHGWKQVKLYFMIGLPTETDEDLEAIVDLCRKVRHAAGRPKLAVTAAISPFVPKPFTPFQWAEQASPESIRRKISVLRKSLRDTKGITLRWHDPEVSYLEGILSRGGRELAQVIARAYEHGALFCSWTEEFTLEPWILAMKHLGLNPEDYLAAKSLDAQLPWDHLEAGIDKNYLRLEWKRAHAQVTTPDCRYAPCNHCGACDTEHPSRMRVRPEDPLYKNRLCNAERDQAAHRPNRDAHGNLCIKEVTRPKIEPHLIQKAVQYRVWHTKVGGSRYVSQLELQSLLMRALRRSRIPVAFSNGFHPMPLLSFGRALPVGVESLAEWFAVSLYKFMPASDLTSRLTPFCPNGIVLTAIDTVTKKDRTLLAVSEIYRLRAQDQRVSQAFKDFFAAKSVLQSFTSKKGEKTLDIRPLVSELRFENTDILFETNWRNGYLSPIKLVAAITDTEEGSLSLRKESQVLGRVYP